MSRQRTLTSALLSVLVAGLAVMGLAAPASAHSQQIGSSPAADEVVATAPSEVLVEFDSALVDMGAAVAVRGQDEESITTGPLSIGDRSLSVPVDPAAPPGTYTVAYRVVSEDGHTITSTFQYTVEGDAPPAVESAAAAPQPVADSTTASSTDAASTDSPTDSAADSGISPILIVVLVALVLIVAAIAAIALRR